MLTLCLYYVRAHDITMLSQYCIAIIRKRIALQCNLSSEETFEKELSLPLNPKAVPEESLEICIVDKNGDIFLKKRVGLSFFSFIYFLYFSALLTKVEVISSGCGNTWLGLAIGSSYSSFSGSLSYNEYFLISNLLCSSKKDGPLPVSYVSPNDSCTASTISGPIP